MRGHNRTRKKDHNRKYFESLRTKFFVEKLRGTLLQPELRTLQVTIFIHAAYLRSSHAFHRITPPLSTGLNAHFLKAVLYAENVGRQGHKQVLR